MPNANWWSLSCSDTFQRAKMVLFNGVLVENGAPRNFHIAAVGSENIISRWCARDGWNDIKKYRFVAICISLERVVYRVEMGLLLTFCVSLHKADSNIYPVKCGTHNSTRRTMSHSYKGAGTPSTKRLISFLSRELIGCLTLSEMVANCLQQKKKCKAINKLQLRGPVFLY